VQNRLVMAGIHVSPVVKITKRGSAGSGRDGGARDGTMPCMQDHELYSGRLADSATINRSGMKARNGLLEDNKSGPDNQVKGIGPTD